MIEGFNPRPGDGLNHLHHGVSRVDKITQSLRCFVPKLLAKKTQAQAQDNARAELRQTLTLVYRHQINSMWHLTASNGRGGCQLKYVLSVLKG